MATRHILCPAWHSGKVINQLFTFSTTIERLRQGPLNKYLDAYAIGVAEQGYMRMLCYAKHHRQGKLK